MAARNFSPGDRNILHVLIRDAVGSSSPRGNRYANVSGPELETNLGTGNRLEFEGSQQEFTQSNSGFSLHRLQNFFCISHEDGFSAWLKNT